MNFPPGFEDDDDAYAAEPLSAEAVRLQQLEERARAWRKLNSKKFGVRREFHQAIAEAKDDRVPAEHLRRIMKEQGDLSSKKDRAGRKQFVQAMPEMPLALMKLIESMPMPWESSSRKVEVIYHVGGAVTIVDETPKTSAPLFKAQWASCFTEMRKYIAELKAQGGTFKYVQFPVFDKNEPVFDFVDRCLDRDGAAPMYCLDIEEESPALAKWFYSDDPVVVVPNKLNLRKGQWYFTAEVMENLLRVAYPLVASHIDDENLFYLWNLKSFYTAKALNLKIPRAPKFKSLCDAEADGAEDDWTEFNDLRQVIFRDDPQKPQLTLLTERQIAYPFLYGRGIRGVVAAPQHAPHSLNLLHDDISMPTFFFDENLNPIVNVEKRFTDADIAAAYHHQQATSDNSFAIDDADDYEFALPDGFCPFLHHIPLEDLHLNSAMQLLQAPAPFNTFSGSLSRRVDIDLMEEWYQEPPNLQPSNEELGEKDRTKLQTSFTHLLKHNIKRRLHRETGRHRHPDPSDNLTGKNQIDRLAETKFFQRTRIEWLEAALQMLRQGHNMITELLHLKGFSKLDLDQNFNLTPKGTLDTKERKKTRLGPSLNILRELLMITKYLVDIHVKARLGHISSFELADGIQYLFSHIGKLTGLYRFKGRINRPINRARAIKHTICSRFHTGEVPRGPGMGFWGPTWRLWMYFLRGIVPWLRVALRNLVGRLFEGRKSKGMKSGLGRRVTRQRVDSDKDVNIKEGFRTELRELLGEDKASTMKNLDKHLNEAFKCWKSNRKWSVDGLSLTLTKLIEKYTLARAEEFTRHAHAVRKQIDTGDTVDKNKFQKNLGRLARLKLIAEQERQRNFNELGHGVISPEDSTAIYELVSNWLADRGFKKIAFPQKSHPAEMDLLRLSLERLRSQHNIGSRMTQVEREEQQLIETAFDSGHEALGRIRESLATQRRFKPVQVEYMDAFSHLYPIYTVDPKEKMVDAFLDAYLWYEATDKQKLFPNWVKPSDDEPNPVLVHKFCSGVNNMSNIWSTANGESTVCLQMDLGEQFYDNVNWQLFSKLLELVMDKTLAAYITSRHGVRLEYKDMEHSHFKGIIRGFRFSGFLAQYWGLVIDLLVLGSRRSQEIAGSPLAPNQFLKFRDPQFATSHPIRGYCRYNQQITVLLRFSETEADDLRQRYLSETNQDPEREKENKSVGGFKTHKNWPRDCRMRLYLDDVNLARAVLWDFQCRIPRSAHIADIGTENSSMSVYSKYNPNLLLDLCGFSVRIQPVSRTEHDFAETENMWILIEQRLKEMTARAFVQCCPASVKMIQNKIRRTLMSVGNAPFTAIAAKWNALITDVVPYFREAILGTAGLQVIFASGEKRMQSRIMMALNSKMAARYPPVMFFAPAEMGGLGMLSIAQSLIPAEDRNYSRTTTTGAQHFMSGITNIDKILIPSILQHYPPWSTEIMESAKAHESFSRILKECKLKGLGVSRDSVEQIIDKGIPRIRTIHFSKNANLFHFDRGFRVRQEFQKYCMGKSLKNWWFHRDHDGSIVPKNTDYEKDMTAALGGVEAILEHSIFRGTGVKSWEGIWWNTKGKFENTVKNNKGITKAQRGGLTGIPNRRFALWWSPTVNRSEVYVGEERQIQLTGVFMCGKLRTIKEAMINLFNGHQWDKIHKSIVRQLHAKLSDDQTSSLFEVGPPLTLVQAHPQKSFTFTSSGADIIMEAASKWLVSDNPSSLHEEVDTFRRMHTKKYWIDVQLRWGDYDRHNIADYAKNTFHKYTHDGKSTYPNSSPTGIILAIDLCYNCHSAYGYWIPGMKEFITKILNVIMNADAELNSLRDRLKQLLSISTSNPTEQSLTTTNIAELMSDKIRTWIVDDSLAYVGSKSKTEDGNIKNKSENGAVLMYEPATGDLRYSVLHKSIFVGKKRRSKLAVDKAAEEIATWLRNTPETERPAKIIVTRKKFCQTLKQMLHEFPNLVINSTELNLAHTQLHLHKRLGDLRTTATESKSYKFCVHDDWRMLNFTSYVQFNLLNMILRGYFVNITRTKEILKPDFHVETHPKHFWPTYTGEQWQVVCDRLQEMILADACRRNQTSVNQLNKTEKSDIIYGKKFTAQDIQEDELKELKAQAKQVQPTAQSTVATTYVSKTGERVTTQVKVTNHGGSTIDQWRPRSIANTNLIRRSATIEPATGTFTAHTDRIIFPRNVVQTLAQCADVHAQVCAYLFGTEDATSGANVKTVLCVMLPPQVCSRQGVKTPERIPFDHAVLKGNGLVLVGTLRVAPGENRVHAKDLALQGRLLSVMAEAADSQRHHGGLCTAIVALGDSSDVSLHAHNTTEAGLMWAAEHFKQAIDQDLHDVLPGHVSLCKATIADDYQGFFLVPKDGRWNHSYLGVSWNQEYEFDCVVDTPLDFFAASSRPEMFRTFLRLADSGSAIKRRDVMDDDLEG